MGAGNPFVIGAVTPTKRFTKRRSDGRTPRKRAIIDESDDESNAISSQPMRAGPSGTDVPRRRRAVIEDSDNESDAVSRQLSRAEISKRPRVTTDRGYDSFDDPEADEAANKACQDGYNSMDDVEENRRMGELCAAPLEAEVAELKAQVARLRDKLEGTTVQRDNWRNTAADHLQAFRSEHHRRVELEREVSHFQREAAEVDAQWEEQDHAIGQLEAQLEEERGKIHELKRKVRDHTAATEIVGICKCLFSTAVQFEPAPDGTTYRRVKPPLGCHRYDVLKVARKYDDGDAWWQQGGPGTWTVAYHGTTLESAQQIVRNGFHMSKAQRAAYGHGLYCTPDLDTARAYALPFTHEGSVYRAVLQCFVDPKEKQSVKPANDAERRDGEYWIVMSGYAIRPYAVCLFAEP